MPALTASDIEHVFREQYGRAVAVLARVFGDIDIAEEAVQDAFAAAVTKAIESEPLIALSREEVAGLPPADWDSVIVATGPLTSPALADALQTLTGEESLAFFDAIAPIVYRDSIDMNIAWLQSRYDKGDGADYIAYTVNAPVNIDGGEGFDTVQILGTEFGDTFVVSDVGTYGAGVYITYAGIEQLQVIGGEGNDTFDVISTSPTMSTVIIGGLGSDTFNVAGRPDRLDPLAVQSNDLRGHSGGGAPAGPAAIAGEEIDPSARRVAERVGDRRDGGRE